MEDEGSMQSEPDDLASATWPCKEYNIVYTRCEPMVSGVRNAANGNIGKWIPCFKKTTAQTEMSSNGNELMAE
jgi:hypothetical protein